MAKKSEKGPGGEAPPARRAPSAGASSSENGIVSAEIAARLIMVTPHRLRQLVRDGHVPAPKGKDRYSLVGVVQGYVKFLKDEERRNSKSAHENKVRDARAREIELRVAEREGRLIELEEHDAVMDEVLAIVREEVAVLPAQMTRDPEKRRELEDKVNAAFDKASARLEQRGQELRESGAVSETLASDDA